LVSSASLYALLHCFLLTFPFVAPTLSQLLGSLSLGLWIMYPLGVSLSLSIPPERAEDDSPLTPPGVSRGMWNRLRGHF
jgi:hypothetical protein